MIKGLFEKFDVTFIILFLINIAALFYLMQKGVESATFYFTLSSFLTSTLFIVVFFFKDIQVLEKKPISDNSNQGTLFFIMGIITFAFLTLFGIAVKNFLNPYFIYSATTVNTFLAGDFRFIQWFITGYSAAVLEELIFGFMFVIIGMIIADWILDRMGISNTWTTRFIVGNIISIFMFTIFHVFNPVYGSTFSWMFVFAAIFRLIMNMLAWLVFDINYTIAFHMANNSVALGLGTTGVALFTNVLGLIFVALFAIMIYGTIRSWKELKFTRWGEQ